MTIEIRPDAGEARIAYQQAHQKTLVAPPDDMWAAFAAWPIRTRSSSTGRWRAAVP